jgi:uncharacterized protein (TIGR02145 family)
VHKGRLYKWCALNDPSGLAHQGWHIPSDDEWIELSDYLGGENAAGGELKSTGTIEDKDGLWNNPNEGANNDSGFSALPGGYRNSIGAFYGIGYDGLWWGSTEYSTATAWGRRLVCSSSFLYRQGSDKVNGLAVRCLRD